MTNLKFSPVAGENFLDHISHGNISVTKVKKLAIQLECSCQREFPVMIGGNITPGMEEMIAKHIVRGHKFTTKNIELKSYSFSCDKCRKKIADLEPN